MKTWYTYTVLQGKFTYIVAGATAVWAIAGFFLGHLDAQTTGTMLLAALGTFGIRRAIANQ